MLFSLQSCVLASFPWHACPTWAHMTPICHACGSHVGPRTVWKPYTALNLRVYANLLKPTSERWTCLICLHTSQNSRFMPVPWKTLPCANSILPKLPGTGHGTCPRFPVSHDASALIGLLLAWQRQLLQSACRGTAPGVRLVNSAGVGHPGLEEVAFGFGTGMCSW